MQHSACLSPACCLFSPIVNAAVWEDCVMQTMWKSHGKMLTGITLLLISLFLRPSTTSAQSPSDTSVCEYQETRQNVPINPKTNQPYTPKQRNQEPFAGASISKEHIKQCLQAQQ